MHQNLVWTKLTTEISETVSQPLIEICGNCRILIEHHRGVVKYERENIEIRMGYGVARIEGKSLELAQITKQQLVITGQITAVFLTGGGNDLQA